MQCSLLACTIYQSMIWHRSQKKPEETWTLPSPNERTIKYIERMFCLNVIWHSYFLIPRQSFNREKTKSMEKFFLQLWNAIWSILLKYQEMYVQIQTFTNEDWNILHSCSFEWYQLPICRLQTEKMQTLYFYSSPAIGNSLSLTQKIHNFWYRK